MAAETDLNKTNHAVRRLALPPRRHECITSCVEEESYIKDAITGMTVEIELDNCLRQVVDHYNIASTPT